MTTGIQPSKMHLLDLSPITIESPPDLNSCCDRIKKCFAAISVWFQLSVVGTIVRKYSYFRTLWWELYNFLASAANLKSFDTVFVVVGNSAQEIWQRISLLDKLVRIVKVLSVVSIPFAILGIVWEVKELINGPDCISSFLRIIENFAWLSESAATFVTGLHMLGTAIQATAMWAYTLYVANTFLSIATIILNCRSLQKDRRFLENLEVAEDAGKGWEYIKTSIKKNGLAFFDVNMTRFNFLINRIDKHIGLLDKSPNDQKKLVGKAITILRERIKAKDVCHKMIIVSSLVTCLGMVILLFTPVFPLAYAMLVLSALIGIVRFFRNRESVQKMDQALLKAL
jgi:hypothetical protein